MAPAHSASASAGADSIKGLAQSIAKPAYRRLLNAEPALRRAVPVLIIAFLLTMAVSALVQVNDHRRQAISNIVRDLDLTADLLAERLAGDNRLTNGELARKVGGILDPMHRQHPGDAGIQFLVTDADGLVIAAAPKTPAVGRPLLDILGAGQPLTTFGASAGVLEIPLADGTQVFATVRSLNAPLGQLALIQPHTAALNFSRSDTALTVTLSATTGFVVLILGFAFHWQATRAREADMIYDMVRGRIDTALNRGRCGLWDWDLARGRIFWSHSMFAILGLDPRDELLTFGEVNALVHPDDIKLYEIATKLADGQTKSVDHDFRMRHAQGQWVWLRARCEIASHPNEPGLHLIGIAVDVTEQKQLVQQTVAADIRLRDAIETIPEAFVLWDSENRLVLCNSNFQELHNLPDSAIAHGIPYDTVVAAGRKPVVHKKVENADHPGARTFEARLDDGRWLHISERRTKDGGYVSVGTDITTLKLHEEKLLEGERRQMATIADLRASQQALKSQT
ncbi:MAG: PAS-domain containing protein, partial [Xanthobacteraceae bacterium]